MLTIVMVSISQFSDNYMDMDFMSAKQKEHYKTQKKKLHSENS